MPDDAPSDTLRGRAAGSRLTLRLLLDADRRLVTALLVAVVFVATVEWNGSDGNGTNEE